MAIDYKLLKDFLDKKVPRIEGGLSRHQRDVMFNECLLATCDPIAMTRNEWLAAIPAKELVDAIRKWIG